jgi:hypothetical protein
MAGARGGQRLVLDPAVYAPSGEPWASVRALYEAGAMAKQSVARLAGVGETTLRARAKREGWAGAGCPAQLRRAGPHPPFGHPGSSPGQALLPPCGREKEETAGAVPPPASPSAALPGSPGGDPTPGTRPGQALPRGEGGCPNSRADGEGAAAVASSPTSPPPDPRTASGRAALVDQLYGLFAAQLAAAGGDDGLGGGLEQRMRSLATFAKTLDALVDLDRRLGGGTETEGADFDAYRAELERRLAGLVGGAGG